MGYEGDDDGQESQGVDTKDTPDVKVEGMRLSFKRPHEDQCGVDEEDEDTEGPKPAGVPSAKLVYPKRERGVVENHQQDSNRAKEIQVSLWLHVVSIEEGGVGGALEA